MRGGGIQSVRLSAVTKCLRTFFFASLFLGLGLGLCVVCGIDDAALRTCAHAHPYEQPKFFGLYSTSLVCILITVTS